MCSRYQVPQCGPTSEGKQARHDTGSHTGASIPRAREEKLDEHTTTKSEREATEPLAMLFSIHSHSASIPRAREEKLDEHTTTKSEREATEPLAMLFSIHSHSLHVFYKNNKAKPTAAQNDLHTVLRHQGAEDRCHEYLAARYTHAAFGT